jgi:hypothetical protein
MMNGELRYLLKTNSDCEACTDQNSLCALLMDLQALAEDLDLDFAAAYQEAGALAALRELASFCPCI